MEENLRLLAINARTGDGCFWRHPESFNYKLVFTSTNKEWLEFKGKMCGRTPVISRKADSRGCFANAKELWSLTTLVNPLFAEYKSKSTEEVIAELEATHFNYWFLDDGCTIEREIVGRRGVLNYRYFLCIGDFLRGSEASEKVFLDRVSAVYADVLAGRPPGRITPNNSKATAMNKTWQMPVCIGRAMVLGAREFGVLGFEKKLRCNL